jgi:hypothetical protein
MDQAAASPRIEYINVPGVGETFADTVHEMVFDGQTFRIELCVTRMEPGSGPAASGKRYTACRLVLPASAALDLSTKLGRVFAAMLKHNAERKAQQQAPAATSPA